MTTEKINQYIKETCKLNNVEFLNKEIKYKFVDNIQDTVAQCYSDIKLIEISGSTWDLLSETEKKNAIVHETAHIVANYLYGESIEDHGEEWKKCVELAREVPVVTYKIRTVKLGCLCASVLVSEFESRKILKENYKCNKCNIYVDEME